MPRDLIKDLELISKATPPPWNGEENTGVEPVFETGCGCCTESTLSKEDAEFIAEAREGWPHAIERAIKAEAEVERLRMALDKIALTALREQAERVLCAKCKHYNKTGCSAGFGWCENMDRGTHDEFYCANGKRLEEHLQYCEIANERIQQALTELDKEGER